MRKRLFQVLIVIIIASSLLGGIVGASTVLLNWSTTSPPASSSATTAGTNDISEVVSKDSPAVVTVTSDAEIASNNNLIPQGTIGSGFIVSSDGTVITSSHVVNDPNTTYYVITQDNKTYPIQKIDRDSVHDIAVVKINVSNLPVVKLGNSDNLKPGQTIIAIGNPFGSLENSVTVGVVSGTNRSITASDIESNSKVELNNLIQIDAAINPGNSGGPLINTQGEVVGINIASSEIAQNIGFAIPVNTVKNKIMLTGSF